MKDVLILIPIYNPKYSERTLKFLEQCKTKFSNILVVNDGSKETYSKIFEEIEKLDIKVIKNPVNMGKGRALKNGINYILQNYDSNIVILTADGDGQHTIEDIEKCYLRALNNKEGLVIGVRDFNQQDVPKRSKFGNKLTKKLFKVILGIEISDTQTGLRAFSYENAKKFLDISGERYEYETNVLIETKKLGIGIVEEKIKTIYIDNNKDSHFNPIKDSIRIYRLFIKQMLRK